ncbi:MAG: phosphatidate cytidylyltransferase [Ignavibacteriaceae bacterium]
MKKVDLLLSLFKISEGCDHPCSFCAIPLMRGQHKSKPMEDLIKETEFLANNGTKELIIIGLIVGVIGQVGDLIESLFKRDAGVKDSSAFIPGHGGIFDRFDSLLYTGPIVLLYLKYLV